MSVFVLGLLGAVTPLAQAAGETPSPQPSATPPSAVSPSASPTASTEPAGTAQPGVPISTMTPQARSRITLVLFDEDIVLVGGRDFAAGDDVTVAAETTSLGGSALTKADADGRFILGFRVPADFKGTVNVKATQGNATAAEALDVTGPEAAAKEFRQAPALPDVPVQHSGSSTATGTTTTPGATATPGAAALPGTTGTAASASPGAASPTVSPGPDAVGSPTPSATTQPSPAVGVTTPPSPTASPSAAEGRGGRRPFGAASPSASAASPSAAGLPTVPPASPGTTTGATAAATPATGGAPEIDAGGSTSGLPWLSGFQSHQLAQLTEFGNWRGRPNDLVHVYTDRTSGWGGLVEPSWPVDLFKGFAGKLLISEPTYPKGQGDNGACARGEYDGQWKKLGSFLVAHGRGDSIVRIGWEFNGTFMYWHTDADATTFRTCFQKISAAIRSTDPQVKIDWTFNAHNSPVPTGNSPWSAYPGDEYVDYVGIDAYDHFPPSKDDATWNKQCEDVNGLCYVIRFAREHGKKVGVGEWGVASCSGDGGGDNPFYIQKMFETFKAAGDVMGYDAYFSDPTPGNVCSTITNGGQNPKAAAEYKKLFGTGAS
ncbi:MULTISPECIES: glycosyl hydrolase [Frankia]|uniref:glycosyl hydrolase n=1 Tax=unclassified Frankia TaxID=2632575 RepID=UPI001E50BB08|nr:MULTISPECIES: glycosyl hydrolase [Frankia]